MSSSISILAALAALAPFKAFERFRTASKPKRPGVACICTVQARASGEEGA